MQIRGTIPSNLIPVPLPVAVVVVSVVAELPEMQTTKKGRKTLRQKRRRIKRKIGSEMETVPTTGKGRKSGEVQRKS